MGNGSTEDGGARFRNALVVANPISGRGRGARAAKELCEGLRRTGIEAAEFLTGAKGDAFERLRGRVDDVDLVVAIGGDGTVREVLEGLVDPAVAVGVVPYGTANVLAGELGLPRDVHHALEILARGRTQELDVARVNGRLSFLVTGIGFDALAVAAVEERRRGPITKASYARGILSALRGYRPPALSVEVDGESLAGAWGFVLASNVARYAGLLRLAADARLDDGLFEVYLFPTGKRGELLRAWLRGALRGLPGGPVEMRRVRRLRVTCDRAVPYQIDGDLGGHTPVELEIAPNRYRLVVP